MVAPVRALLAWVLLLVAAHTARATGVPTYFTVAGRRYYCLGQAFGEALPARWASATTLQTVDVTENCLSVPLLNASQLARVRALAACVAPALPNRTTDRRPLRMRCCWCLPAIAATLT